MGKDAALKQKEGGRGGTGVNDLSGAAAAGSSIGGAGRAGHGYRHGYGEVDADVENCNVIAFIIVCVLVEAPSTAGSTSNAPVTQLPAPAHAPSQPLPLPFPVLPHRTRPANVTNTLPPRLHQQPMHMHMPIPQGQQQSCDLGGRTLLLRVKRAVRQQQQRATPGWAGRTRPGLRRTEGRRLQHQREGCNDGARVGNPTRPDAEGGASCETGAVTANPPACQHYHQHTSSISCPTRLSAPPCRVAPPPKTLATNLTKALPQHLLYQLIPQGQRLTYNLCVLAVLWERGAPGWGQAGREQGSKARGKEVQRQERLQQRQTRQVVGMSNRKQKLHVQTQSNNESKWQPSIGLLALWYCREAHGVGWAGWEHACGAGRKVGRGCTWRKAATMFLTLK